MFIDVLITNRFLVNREFYWLRRRFTVRWYQFYTTHLSDVTTQYQYVFLLRIDSLGSLLWKKNTRFFLRWSEVFSLSHFCVDLIFVLIRFFDGILWIKNSRASEHVHFSSRRNSMQLHSCNGVYIIMLDQNGECKVWWL